MFTIANQSCVTSLVHLKIKVELYFFTEWFQTQREFETPFEEMSPTELNKCLQKFYLSARKRDGSFYNKKSLTAIRAALDRHLRSPPFSKPFSITGDSQFNDANTSLNNFLKTLSKSGEIAPTVHKQPLTKEVVAKLYEEGELVDTDSLQPHKLQQTAWFFISLFLGKRGRENQQLLKKHMLVARETPSGEKYLEMSRERGAVLATKNHQGGLDDKEDESNGKIFERPGSKRCPVKLIEKYLSHLNPECSSLFQKPRSPCKSFNPARDAVWYCSTPLGHNTLHNMLRFMTTRAGIIPHLTNHSIRATTITVLSAANIESRHIKAITGHQSEASIQSYCDTPTFEQFKTMSNELGELFDPAVNENNAVAVTHSAVFPTPAPSNQLPSAIPSTSGGGNQFVFESIQDGSQNLAHGVVPGGTFHNCSFNFNVSFGDSSRK